MKVLAVCSVKGGVGKTSAAVSMAHLAAAEGYRTLLWDLDPQGAATWMLGRKARVKGGVDAALGDKGALPSLLRGTDIPGLDLVPADWSYRTMDQTLAGSAKPVRRIARQLKDLRAGYELVVLDCPPGMDLVGEAIVSAADVLLVPVVPSTLAVRALDQLVEFVAQTDPPRPRVTAFLSLVDRRRLLHRQLVESLPVERPELLPVAVPASSAVERMAVTRSPVTATSPRSAPALAYAALWSQLRPVLL